MLAGVAQGRVIANILALRVLEIFLLEGDEGKGGRIGAFETVAHASGQQVKDTADLVVIEHLLDGHALRVFQGAAKVQGVQQGDRDVGGNDGEGDHAQFRTEHFCPALAGLGVPAQAVEKAGQRNHQ